jgi:hypothetical protein
MTRQAGEPIRTVAKGLYAAVLEHFMRSSGLSPQWIANATGLDLSYVYYVQRGGRLPSLRTTEQLDEAVGAGGLLIKIRMLLDQLHDAARGTPVPVPVGPVIVGPWRLDVDEKGRLVAEDDAGNMTVIAGNGSP